MRFSEALELLAAGKKITKKKKLDNSSNWHLYLHPKGYIATPSGTKYPFTHAEYFEDCWELHIETFDFQTAIKHMEAGRTVYNSSTPCIEYFIQDTNTYYKVFTVETPNIKTFRYKDIKSTDWFLAEQEEPGNGLCFTWCCCTKLIENTIKE